MKPSALILTALLTLSAALTASAQRLPVAQDERSKCGIQIDLGKACLTGVCLMLMDGGVVKASVVNEFGVSFADFTYSPSGGRVRLLSVNSLLDRWYIRRALRKDLRSLMEGLRSGQTEYRRKGRIYRLLPDVQ